MRAVLWPQSQLEPAHQVVVGKVAGDTLPAIFKYGVELGPDDHDPEDSLVGRPTRRRKVTA